MIYTAYAEADAFEAAGRDNTVVRNLRNADSIKRAENEVESRNICIW